MPPYPIHIILLPKTRRRNKFLGLSDRSDYPDHFSERSLSARHSLPRGEGGGVGAEIAALDIDGPDNGGTISYCN